MSKRLKLQIASDLHREFGHNPPVLDIGADVLVLAGDIGYRTEPSADSYREQPKSGHYNRPHDPS